MPTYCNGMISLCIYLAHKVNTFHALLFAISLSAQWHIHETMFEDEHFFLE